MEEEALLQNTAYSLQKTPGIARQEGRGSFHLGVGGGKVWGAKDETDGAARHGWRHRWSGKDDKHLAGSRKD